MRSKFIRSIAAVALIAAVAAPLSGCVVTTADDEPLPAPLAGTLTVNYTIEGTTDPSVCSYYGVVDIELVVYVASGAFVAEEQAYCSDFQVSIALPSGTYSADVTLVDDVDRAMSVSKPLYDLRVLTDAELVVDLDFPPASML